METEFLEKEIWIIEVKIIRVNRVDIKMWGFEVFLSVWVWASYFEGLFVEFSVWDEEVVYGEGGVDWDDMELIFGFDK